MASASLSLFVKLWTLFNVVSISTGFLEDVGKNTKPHIVFVIADDLGYNDIGYHGSEIKTPVMDQLSGEGVRLENYYVQSICTPSRSALFTGRHAIHMGVQNRVFSPPDVNGVPLDTPFISDMLRHRGYSTHMVGKWQLGMYKKEYLPWNRGFDTFLGFLGGCDDYYEHTRNYSDVPIAFKDRLGKGTAYLDLWTQDGPYWNASGIYNTYLYSQRIVDIINSHDPSDKPLFMVVSYKAGHTPLQVPPEYEAQYSDIKDDKRRLFAGVVTAMDEGMGNITDALKAQGMWDDTVFVFTTDNGANARQGGNNFPLRGQKTTPWEGGVKAVGFVAGGYLDARGVVYNDLMDATDWVPTFMGLAGGLDSDVATQPIDGIDQWKSINTGAPGERKVLLHNILDNDKKRVGKPLYKDTFDTSVSASLRAGDYKIITGKAPLPDWVPTPDAGKPEKAKRIPDKNVWLFNIKEDPTEHNDLSDSMPGKVRELLDMLVEFDKTAVSAIEQYRAEGSNPALHGGVWGPWE